MPYNLNLPSMKEPKDPPLIENFKKKMEGSGVMRVSNYDRRKEISLNKAKKRLEASDLEGRLISEDSRLKDFLANKRLYNARKQKVSYDRN